MKTIRTIYAEMLSRGVSPVPLSNTLLLLLAHGIIKGFANSKDILFSGPCSEESRCEHVCTTITPSPGTSGNESPAAARPHQVPRHHCRCNAGFELQQNGFGCTHFTTRIPMKLPVLPRAANTSPRGTVQVAGGGLIRVAVYEYASTRRASRCHFRGTRRNHLIHPHRLIDEQRYNEASEMTNKVPLNINANFLLYGLFTNIPDHRLYQIVTSYRHESTLKRTVLTVTLQKSFLRVTLEGYSETAISLLGCRPLTSWQEHRVAIQSKGGTVQLAVDGEVCGKTTPLPVITFAKQHLVTTSFKTIHERWLNAHDKVCGANFKLTFS